MGYFVMGSNAELFEGTRCSIGKRQSCINALQPNTHDNIKQKKRPSIRAHESRTSILVERFAR